MKIRRLLTRLCALAIACLPAAVLAHEGSSLPFGSFLAGLTHPVLGPDHFLAMVSVGILSAQIGGRAIWTVPAAFVGTMAAGGLLGLTNTGLSIVEAGIALSVLVLGIAIAAERSLPMTLAMTAVAFFGVFHGYAHGAEMPSVAEPARYAAGFLTGTAGLHVLGIIIGDISQHYARGRVMLRVAGAAIASVGTWFLVAAI